MRSGPGLRGVWELRRLLEGAIAEGPPAEAAYGRENLGRYVHTLSLLLDRGRAPGGRVLDAGIYPGHLALALVRLGGVALDGLGTRFPPGFAPLMAARGVTLAGTDLEREPLPFPAASFDTVLATEVLEHLGHPGHFLAECLRVLRPGGRLVLSTPNVVDLRGRLRALSGSSPQSHLYGIGRVFRMNEWVHRREYAPGEVRALLAASGFGAVALHTWTPTRRDGGRSRFAWLVNRVPGLGGTIFAAAVRPEPGTSPARVDRAALAPASRWLALAPGAVGRLAVRAENTGSTSWETGRVALGVHLLDLDGRLLDRDLARAPFPRAVAPGETVDLAVEVRVPAAPGAYLLAIDVVREGEHWFGDDGSPSPQVALTVAGPHG